MSDLSFTNFVKHLFSDSEFFVCFALFTFLDGVAHGLEGELTVPFYLEMK